MARGRPPSFQIYPSPWFADTRLMTRDQRCRYFEALMHSWLEECYGVAPEDQWRRWMGYTPKQWARFREVFLPRFKVDGDLWVQKRLLEVRAEQLSHRINGASGGAARARGLDDLAKSLQAQVAANTRWDAYRMRSENRPLKGGALASASPSEEKDSPPATPHHLPPSLAVTGILKRGG